MPITNIEDYTSDCSARDERQSGFITTEQPRRWSEPERVDPDLIEAISLARRVDCRTAHDRNLIDSALISAKVAGIKIGKKINWRHVAVSLLIGSGIGFFLCLALVQIAMEANK